MEDNYFINPLFSQVSEEIFPDIDQRSLEKSIVSNFAGININTKATGSSMSKDTRGKSSQVNKDEITSSQSDPDNAIMSLRSAKKIKSAEDNTSDTDYMNQSFIRTRKAAERRGKEKSANPRQHLTPEEKAAGARPYSEQFKEFMGASAYFSASESVKSQVTENANLVRDSAVWKFAALVQLKDSSQQDALLFNLGFEAGRKAEQQLFKETVTKELSSIREEIGSIRSSSSDTLNSIKTIANADRISTNAQSQKTSALSMNKELQYATKVLNLDRPSSVVAIKPINEDQERELRKALGSYFDYFIMRRNQGVNQELIIEEIKKQKRALKK